MKSHQNRIELVTRPGLLKEEVPGHHRSSGWVLGQMGKAHFELGQYKEAKKCFREMRDRDPHRLEMTEVNDSSSQGQARGYSKIH